MGGGRGPKTGNEARCVEKTRSWRGGSVATMSIAKKINATERIATAAWPAFVGTSAAKKINATERRTRKRRARSERCISWSVYAGLGVERELHTRTRAGSYKPAYQGGRGRWLEPRIGVSFGKFGVGRLVELGGLVVEFGW